MPSAVTSRRRTAPPAGPRCATSAVSHASVELASICPSVHPSPPTRPTSPEGAEHADRVRLFLHAGAHVLLPYFDECSANLGDAATLFDDVVALCQAAEAQEPSHCRCTDQSAPCWPSATVWNQLNVSVGGRLLVPDWAGFQHCFGAPSDLPECVSAVGKSRSNNFMNQLHAGLTESTGWFNGWDATPSAYAVEATTAADIQAAVRFAAAHNLRVVIKGTGHDYKGRSTAPNSLLIWTHLMRDITWSGDDITVGAGVTWDEVRSDLQPRTCTQT